MLVEICTASRAVGKRRQTARAYANEDVDDERTTARENIPFRYGTSSRLGNAVADRGVRGNPIYRERMIDRDVVVDSIHPPTNGRARVPAGQKQRRRSRVVASPFLTKHNDTRDTATRHKRQRH